MQGNLPPLEVVQIEALHNRVGELEGILGDVLERERSAKREANRLRAALEIELRDATAEIERLCGAMPRDRFNYYVEHSIRVQRIRGALRAAAPDQRALGRED
jgi:hypothetical protein